MSLRFIKTVIFTFIFIGTSVGFHSAKAQSAVETLNAIRNGAYELPSYVEEMLYIEILRNPFLSEYRRTEMAQRLVYYLDIEDLPENFKKVLILIY